MKSKFLRYEGQFAEPQYKVVEATDISGLEDFIITISGQEPEVIPIARTHIINQDNLLTQYVVSDGFYIGAWRSNATGMDWRKSNIGIGMLANTSTTLTDDDYVQESMLEHIRVQIDKAERPWVVATAYAAGAIVSQPITAAGIQTLWQAQNAETSATTDGFYTEIDTCTSFYGEIPGTLEVRQGSDTSYNESICWSPDLRLFVAAAIAASTYGPRFMTSSDGITWTDISGPYYYSYARPTWQDVCWAGGSIQKFIAVGLDSGTGMSLAYSSNGSSWNGSGYIAYGTLSVCYCSTNDKLVAMTQGVAYTSTNGTSWTGHSDTSLNEHESARVCYSPELDMYVSVGNNYSEDRVVISYDGESWGVSVTGESTDEWKDVCWGAGANIFVATRYSAADGGYIFVTSTNGTSWTDRNSVVYDEQIAVCWSEARDCFVAYTGTTALTSANGITWTTLETIYDANWSGVTYAPEIDTYCGVSSASKYHSSLVYTGSTAGDWVLESNWTGAETLSHTGSADTATYNTAIDCSGSDYIGITFSVVSVTGSPTITAAIDGVSATFNSAVAGKKIYATIPKTDSSGVLTITCAGTVELNNMYVYEGYMPGVTEVVDGDITWRCFGILDETYDSDWELVNTNADLITYSCPTGDDGSAATLIYALEQLRLGEYIPDTFFDEQSKHSGYTYIEALKEILAANIIDQIDDHLTYAFQNAIHPETGTATYKYLTNNCEVWAGLNAAYNFFSDSRCGTATAYLNSLNMYRSMIEGGIQDLYNSATGSFLYYAGENVLSRPTTKTFDPYLSCQTWPCLFEVPVSYEAASNAVEYMRTNSSEWWKDNLSALGSHTGLCKFDINNYYVKEITEAVETNSLLYTETFPTLDNLGYYIYMMTGAAQTVGVIRRHDQLAGLTDDDHPQYLTEARGDGRYYTQDNLNEGQLDSRYYTEYEIGVTLSGINDTIITTSGVLVEQMIEYDLTTSGVLDNKLEAHKISADHDPRYFTKEEVTALIGHNRFGKEPLVSGTTQTTILFDSEFPNDNYSLNVSLESEDEIASEYVINIIETTISGFIVEYSDELDSANFYLNWGAMTSGTITDDAFCTAAYLDTISGSLHEEMVALGEYFSTVSGSVDVQYQSYIDAFSDYADSASGTLVTVGDYYTSWLTAASGNLVAVVDSTVSGLQYQFDTISGAINSWGDELLATSGTLQTQITDNIRTYNATNFTVTSGEVNTIQDIATTSDVTFAHVNNQSLQNNFASTYQTISGSIGRTYVNGSALSLANGLQVGTMMRWTLAIAKTAAGTASSTYGIAFGTNGTTDDTTRVSFTKPAGTAAVDAAHVTIDCTIRGPITASGVAVGIFSMTHNLAATGFATIPCVNVINVGSAFNLTTPTYAGICLTPGASEVVSVSIVRAETWNL